MKQSDVDSYLRQVLEPEPGSARRVARQALRPPSPSPRRLRWRLVAAPAICVLVALAGSLWWSLGSSPAPPAARPVVVEIRRTHRPAFEITNSGGVVAVTSPTGQVLAIVSGGNS